MKNCNGCGREFVDKVTNDKTECTCHKWLCGEEVDNSRKYDCIQYLCQDCDHELRRTTRVQDRAKRELTPKKGE